MPPARRQRPAPPLLAQGRGDVIVGAAIVRLALAAGDQHLRRTGLGGIGVEALALFVALALTQPVGGGLAVWRAVGAGRTECSSRNHRAGVQTRQRIARILGARVEIVEGLARA